MPPPFNELEDQMEPAVLQTERDAMQAVGAAGALVQANVPPRLAPRRKAQQKNTTQDALWSTIGSHLSASDSSRPCFPGGAQH